MSAVQSRRVLALVLAVAATPVVGMAADRYYVGPSGGNWNDPANWSATAAGPGGAGVPTDGDTVFATAPVATPIVYRGLTYGGNTTGAGFAAFAVDGPLELDQTAATTLKVAGSLSVNPYGDFRQSNGTVTAGELHTDRGSYRISAGTLNLTTPSFTGPLVVGATASGPFTVSGNALVNVNGNANVGLDTAGNGQFTQDGGTVTIGNASTPGSGALYLGRNAGFGKYSLSQPADSTATLTVHGNLYAGYAGTGVAFQSGGSVVLTGDGNANVGYLQIAASTAGSSGSYNISGGSLSASAGIDVGGDAGVAHGTGTFTVSNNATVTAANLVVYETGTATLNGGVVNALLGTAVHGPGTLTVNGGTLNTNPNLAGYGLQCVTGGVVNINGGTVNVGDLNLEGTVTNAGGTVNIARSLYSFGGTGVYNQSAGLTTFTDQSIIQAGVMHVTGGTVTAGGRLLIGQTNSSGAGNASLVVTSGALTAGTLGVGNDGSLTGGAGTGSVSVSGGTLYADTVILGSTNGGSGTMTVSGNAAVTVGGGLYGNDLTVNGGSVTILDQDPPAGEDAILNRSMVVGYLRNGAFNFNGGTTTSPNIKLGITAGKTGTYAQTAGTVNVGILGAGNDATMSAGAGNGVVTISGGVLNADTVLLGNNNGTGGGDMTVSGTATLNIKGGLWANDLNVAGGSVTVADQSATGNYPVGEDVVLHDAIVGGYQHDGALNVSGGAVTSPKIKLGITAGKVGAFTQTSGNVHVGILSAGNDASLTSGAGTGHITLSGGTTYADTVILGSTVGGSGDMTVSGTAALTVGGGLAFNDLTVNGGTVTVLDQNPPAGEDAVLNRAMVGGYLRDGAFNINGGKTTTPILKLGVTAGKTGTFTQTGGSVSVGQTLLGSAAGGIGKATLAGGTFKAGTLTVESTGSMTLKSGSRAALQTTGLTLNGATPLIDLNDNGMTLKNGSTYTAYVKGWIGSSRNAGTWNGPRGITSTTAANSNGRGAVGYALRSDLATLPAAFNGLDVDDNTLLIRYTLNGDATLDGTVNFDDLTRLAQHYNQASGAGWSDGDFTYDAVVNFDDLIPLAQNYNNSIPASQRAALETLGGTGFAADWALAQSLVPEPTSLSTLAVAALVMRRRRVNGRRCGRS